MNKICSFCEKASKKLIEGPVINTQQIYICNKCVDLCSQAFNSTPAKKLPKSQKLLAPEEIFAYLEKHIVGQTSAKRAMSVSIYNHYKRLSNTSDIKLDKSNLLLIGPSGCGKTLLVSTIAQLLDVPVVFEDATTFSEVGYVGKDVDVMIKNLLAKAKGNVELAQRGIVFIDEIDKISGKATEKVKDVNGVGVQHGLLKMIEGSEVRIQQDNGSYAVVDTSNILFICSGAFDGLEKIIFERLNKVGIGFGSAVVDKSVINNMLKNVVQEDLIKYGLVREFAGRLHFTATLEQLTEEDLVKIITEPENSISKQFTELFKMDGAELTLSAGYIKSLASDAISRKTGARALRSTIESKLLDVQYELPTLVKSGVKTIEIDDTGNINYVRGNITSEKRKTSRKTNRSSS